MMVDGAEEGQLKGPIDVLAPYSSSRAGVAAVEDPGSCVRNGGDGHATGSQHDDSRHQGDSDRASRETLPPSVPLTLFVSDRDSNAHRWPPC
jgi:hypothetical protein